MSATLTAFSDSILIVIDMQLIPGCFSPVPQWVLSVSVVELRRTKDHHRDTEDSQRHGAISTRRYLDPICRSKSKIRDYNQPRRFLIRLLSVPGAVATGS